MFAGMFNGDDELPVFYVIMLIDRPEQVYGAVLENGFQALYLFERESDALRCLTNRHPDPENAEVVGSDKLGGILALLAYAAQLCTHVVLNCRPTKGPQIVEAMEISTFIYEYVLRNVAA